MDPLKRMVVYSAVGLRMKKGPYLAELMSQEDSCPTPGLELPVNLKFCFEGMEESESTKLDELVNKEAEKGGWFDGVDCICKVLHVIYLTPSEVMN